MNCPACQHQNRDGAKFCEECANPLKRVCGSCGAELRPTAKFCDECGTPATGSPARDTPGTPTSQQQRPKAADAGSGDSTRKIVSIIFADLAGSTALHERLDAESARLFMEGYYRAMRGAVEAHGGMVAKLLGDGVMAVFGLPLVAEDDAIRAVHAAVDMQRVFRELAERHGTLVGKVGLRVAVNTGEVVAKDETELIGDPVNVAARLQDQAGDGDVVIGESTRRLVAALITLEPLGSLTLKGRAEAVNAYRVLSLDKPASATTAAFVGREEELARLAAVFGAATTTPAARLAVLVGSPGLGKSRLIDEFIRRAGNEASIIAAHCDTAGGSSFAPITRALRRFLGLGDSATPDAVRAAVDEAVSGNDADRIRIVDGVTALLGGSPASPEETFFVVRRFLTALTASRPVVLVIDDLHSAERLLFDLVEHLVQWGSGVPLFVLAGARPELRDARSSLTNTGGVVTDVVTLGGLDAGAAMRLAANMIGAADLPAAIAAKVLASSEGNPLFVGELVRMLVHEGALTREGDRWTVGVALAALEMPPTIHALLASRIERLRAEDRTVLERAAVVGRNFSRSAVAALLPQSAADLDACLESLRRSELIESDSGWFLGEPVLRFHHVLIRDAAYRRLLKGTRAELHGRLAEWIESRAAGAAEHDETIGSHLEQAYLHLRELGPIDERGRAIGEKAAMRLASAGRASLARDDLSLATGLLGRALPCLDAVDPSRAELAVDWCEAVLAAGDVTTANAAITELARYIDDSPRLRAWHTCFSGQLVALTDPQALNESADAVAGAAAELTELGDAAGEAKAHSVRAQALARLGRVGDCEAALDLALAAARRAGDRRRANFVLAGAPVAALWGPSPVTRASGRCLDVVRVLRITQGAPAVEAVALSCQGVLEALRGRTDAARRMIAMSRDMVEELGISHRLHEADVFAGRIELLEGDAAKAEQRLRGAYDGLRELGLGIDAARAAALLARALLALDRADEAEALSLESEALAGDDLQAAIAWRGVRAEALAKRGEHTGAVEFARASVAIAAATDALLDHADARLALAAALRASGRMAEADAERRRAIELWEAKGATLLADRARGKVTEGKAATGPVAHESEPDSASSRRIHENVATRHFAQFAATIRAGEIDAALDMFAEDFVGLSHPTGTTYDKAAMAENLRQSAASTVVGLLYECVPLAGLGENLCLGRQLIRADSMEDDRALSFGAFEMESYFVFDVDETGRRRQVEIFASDHLTDAIVRLYELHAAQIPAGPDHDRAQATAHSVKAILPPGSPSERSAATALQIEFHDHRLTGVGEIRGRAQVDELYEVLDSLASDMVWQVDDVVCIDYHALVLRGSNRGTDRLSGGDFERLVCFAWVYGEDGLLTNWDVFEPEDTASALARVDELTLGGYSPPPPESTHARRVHENAATRHFTQFAAVIAAGEPEMALDMISEDFIALHHPTATTYDKAGLADNVLQLATSAGLSIECVPLAGLGENLCLGHQLIRADGVEFGRDVSVGAFEMENYFVFDVDGDGRRRNVEVFSTDHLAEAMLRLYEMHAAQLPAGPLRDRAAAIARSMGIIQTALDSPEYASALNPEMSAHDHRLTGVGELRGRTTFLKLYATLQDLATEITWHTDDVVYLGDDVLVSKATNRGEDRLSGGAFERPLCILWAFGKDGLLTHWEVFEPEDTANALARLDELAPSQYSPRTPAKSQVRPSAAEPRPNATDRNRSGNGNASSSPSNEEGATTSLFENSASRCWRVLLKRYQAADWSRWGSELAPGFHYSDRRPMAQLELDRDDYMLFQTQFSRMQTTALDSKLVATRGERLCLFQIYLEVSDETVGPSVIEHLNVVEIDAHGQAVALVRMPLEDIDAAFAELDARYQAGEGKEHAATEEWRCRFGQAYASSDWEAAVSLMAPDLVTRDHRLLGWGNLEGVGEWVKYLKGLRDLAPDTTINLEHLRIADLAILSESLVSGTRDGGQYEMAPHIVVRELDARGLCKQIDFYDIDRGDQAFERFRAICGGAAAAGSPASFAAPFPENNLATEAWRRYRAVLETRDWETIRTMVREDVVYEDRRSHAQVSGGLELWMSDEKLAATMVENAQQEARTLGVFGTQIAVERVLWSGGPDDGRVEIEFLSVTDVDEDGRFARSVLFGPDQIREAQREALSRWIEIDPDAPIFGAQLADICEAFDRKDPDAIQRILGENYVVEDHRLVGVGRINNTKAYVNSIAELWKLAPDTHLDGAWSALAYRRDGWITTLHRYGNLPDGGAFESEYLCLTTHQDGRTNSDLYEVESVDAALARFEELRPVAQSIPPNRATVGGNSRFDDFLAGNWDNLRRLVDDNFSYEDRSRRALVTGDVETWIASMRFMAELPGFRVEQEPVAVFGDLIELRRFRFLSEPEGGGVSEIEKLRLFEIGANGRVRSTLLFDPEDQAEACQEALRRFVAAEAGPGEELAPIVVLTEAFLRHDMEAMRSVLSPAFELCDHRPLSFGVINGNTWIESIGAMGESAPDYRADILRVLTHSRHGFVAVMRIYGNLRDGGPFENFFVGIYMVSGSKVTRAEIFPEEDMDKAVARFHELNAQLENRVILIPTSIPSNAASKTWPAVAEAFLAGDRERIFSLVTPDFRYRDLGKRALVEGDWNTWVESVEFLVARAQTRLERLATIGDRILIDRLHWISNEDGPEWELERIRVVEVNADGKLVESTLYDLDDRPLGFFAALECFAAHEAGGADGLTTYVAFVRALLRYDWEAMRQCISPQLRFDDRRPLSLGVLDGEQWIASLRVQVDMAPDLASEVSEVLAWSEHAFLASLRTYGNLRDAGPFENIFLCVFAASAGKLTLVEPFPINARAEALARFEEIASQ